MSKLPLTVAVSRYDHVADVLNGVVPVQGVDLNVLNLPLHDPEFAYAMAPMAKGLRITSGAELMGPERSSQSRQLERAEQAARRLVDLGTAVEAEPWSGVRPCMPDMLPVVGAAPKHKGLWMHFGHGHHGHTLGPTTGRLLAEMMSGEQPFTDVTAFSPARY